MLQCGAVASIIRSGGFVSIAELFLQFEGMGKALDGIKYGT